MSDRVDALVIFGATGDLAKLETFPALVGLVERDVLNVPVIGVSKRGWDLERFRDYAVASLKLNNMDPSSRAATKMLGLLRYVDGDLGDDATYHAMSEVLSAGEGVLYYLEVPQVLFGQIAQGIVTSRLALATVRAEPLDGQGLSGWRNAKSRLVASIRPLEAQDAVRGQYDGYLDVEGVEPHSIVETFVAVRLAVDTWRWADVPVLIRAGKCMPVTATEVTVRFRRPPRDIFGLAPLPAANELRFRVWPETRLSLTLAG